ncbi:MAG: RnfABCDGE type electron transport complex subunit D [Gammaproteobacteria bacterium]|jgi:electron transport complex protein RnfD|uniref:RnfABCDGE type electron transport complex subunit D n=1 Tax=Candidatus Njordibacter sp. Uisw_058 TaxID=3230974 RepID=UPI0023968048|nr:RnfABCDGE type electron transport complex subunit D [Pseudomonadales bacterium]CAI8397480.1 MAG: Electron transport complex subunit RsxD [Oceanospirillaceae bacterium UBA2001]|tara:strand:- start:13277 stop:14311 length:1035 start_codon:yes stop_codon:yes gene_type:complete
MALMNLSSPHHHSLSKTSRLMAWVLLATLPGLAVQSYFYGYGTLINLVWASGLALGLEALVLGLRRRPIMIFLTDGSALVTAFLIALALPPFSPWWLTLIAVLFSIVFAKHLYGGLGNNPFNPAMVGYAICLIAFPVSMTQWPAIEQTLSFGQQWQWFWMESIDGGIDAWTGATALDLMRHTNGLTLNEVALDNPQLGLSLSVSMWVNLAYLAGGIGLLAINAFTWHAPIAMLASLGFCAGLFHMGEPDLYPSASQHLLTGATMFSAFFIVTDPVSGATSRKGKVVFGIGVGILVFIIRTFGSYPDAFAFAILLMNLSAPLIDTYTRPKAYGHKPSKSSSQGDL